MPVTLMCTGAKYTEKTIDELAIPACRLRQAKQDAARLHRVLETLTPPPDSPELALVPGGLRGFVSAGEARLLLSAYRELQGAESTAWACAAALDL